MVNFIHLRASGNGYTPPSLLETLVDTLSWLISKMCSARHSHEPKYAIAMNVVTWAGIAWVAYNVNEMLANRQEQITSDVDFHDMLQGSNNPDIIACHSHPSKSLYGEVNNELTGSDCRMYATFYDAAMFKPCNSYTDSKDTCVDIDFEVLEIFNEQDNSPQNCFVLDLSEIEFTTRSQVLRCVGQIVEPEVEGVPSDGGGDDGGDGGSEPTPTDDSSGGDSEPDCSGEGVDWGPGLAPPPEGCEPPPRPDEDGGRRLEDPDTGIPDDIDPDVAAFARTLIPDALIISLYDRDHFTPNEGRLNSQVPADDKMAFIEWKSTRLIDKTKDVTTRETLFDASSMTTKNALEDGYFSVLFRPATFQTVRITRFYDGYLDYIDNIGGFTSAAELLLGFVAVVFWTLVPIRQAVRGKDARRFNSRSNAGAGVGGVSGGDEAWQGRDVEMVANQVVEKGVRLV
jgi:hypothetical protein